jgi:hypothetical protein
MGRAKATAYNQIGQHVVPSLASRTEQPDSADPTSLDAGVLGGVEVSAKLGVAVVPIAVGAMGVEVTVLVSEAVAAGVAGIGPSVSLGVSGGAGVGEGGKGVSVLASWTVGVLLEVGVARLIGSGSA